MKKLILILTFVLTLVFVFTACNSGSMLGGTPGMPDTPSTPNEPDASTSPNDPVHTHSYSTTWTSNATHHWHACQNEGCASISNETAHAFGEWVIDVVDTCMQSGTRHHVCTVCNKSVSENYSDANVHNYATAWTTDSTNHWHECQNSGCTSVVDKTSHIFGEWIVDEAATCQKSGTRHHVCTVCNKPVSESYSDATAHNYATGWTSDDTNHWHKCQNSGCTSVSGKNTHNVVDGRCTECYKTTTYYRDGDYIYFGEYPQTIKANSVTITSTQDSRGYYLGSDGFYYAKVTADPYGSYTFSTGTKVTDGTVYYFKVEPIRWRILSESGGTAFILCDRIIANKRFDDDSNNYKDSEIRAWLNGTFYETAFDDLQKALVNTVTVDNSVASTGYSENQYACEDTSDKVFLLSYKEVTNADYGFSSSGQSDTARQMTVSDYARATGAYMYYGNGYWWLRSPFYNSSFSARGVRYDGYVNDYSVYGTNFGVVPALQIRLR